MTQGRLSDHDRRVIVPCASVALVLSAATPFLWPEVAERIGSSDATLWATVVVWTLPTCLALAAVVLTARPFSGVAVAVACGVVGITAFMLSVVGDGPDRMPFGVRDVAGWMFWALLMACALLAADLMAQRLGSFTAITGLVAGVSVALGVALVRLANMATGFDWDFFGQVPVSYWLTQYAGPTALLVLTGLLAGAAGTRHELRQETAGVA